MKRNFLAVFMAVFISVPGLTYADEPEHDHEHDQKRNVMGKGMGMMEMGEMGHGMMGMCPMMTPNAKIEIKDVKNGISITITSNDKKEADRIQKKGKIMQLMRELHESE